MSRDAAPETMYPEFGLSVLPSGIGADSAQDNDALADTVRYFPFSNDENCEPYVEVSDRVGTLEYRKAKTHVALLVGEASLACALSKDLLPEETIVVVDVMPRMAVHMKRYVAALQGEAELGMWHQRMSLTPYERRMLDDQITYWNDHSMPHPLDSPGHYAAAHRAAVSKEILVINSSIADETAMRRLGKGLREGHARVTMANISNVLELDCNYDPTTKKYVPGRDEIVNTIGVLPFTPNAPILTSESRRRGDGAVGGAQFMVPAKPIAYGIHALERASQRVLEQRRGGIEPRTSFWERLKQAW